MDERDIGGLVEAVATGRLTRRRFVAAMARAGLTLPMAGTLLMNAGVASAAVRQQYKPAKRGGGGTLRMLMWQGPTILNPHLATGTKDLYGARIFYQALAEWDSEANLIPVLAAELPSHENGGLSRDGRTVVWKLKPGVQWHDGRPFGADDLAFTRDFAADPAGGSASVGVYNDVAVQKIDALTVRLVFDKPTPYWAEPFVGARGLILPRHLFEGYTGARAREAPANSKPVGTGAYRFAAFTPGDMLRGTLNPAYHEPNRPFFDMVEMKGGGDAVSAARAVLQTGEFDYAWNLQVEDEILRRLEQGGKGRVVILPGGNIEYIQLNCTDPWIEIAGERSSAKSRHPVWSDRAVRDAFSLLVDRATIVQHVYGRTGIATANFLYNPERFRSPNTKMEFDPAKANATLDAAGWKRGADGIRAKDGRKLKFLFQTSINAPRQKVQAIVKQSCQKAGMDIELKAIPASVFFGADVGNNDTNAKFLADIQMYSWGGNVDPELFMHTFCSWEISQKDNKWGGRNVVRWRNDEYDRLYRAAQTELDAPRRTAMFIRMNDIVVADRYVVPIANRPQVAALAKNIRAQLSTWSQDVSFIQDWYREG